MQERDRERERERKRKLELKKPGCVSEDEPRLQRKVSISLPYERVSHTDNFLNPSPSKMISNHEKVNIEKKDFRADFHSLR